jgi:hypothetical protein
MSIANLFQPEPVRGDSRPKIERDGDEVAYIGTDKGDGLWVERGEESLGGGEEPVEAVIIGKVKMEMLEFGEGRGRECGDRENVNRIIVGERMAAEVKMGDMVKRQGLFEGEEARASGLERTQ